MNENLSESERSSEYCRTQVGVCHERYGLNNIDER